MTSQGKASWCALFPGQGSQSPGMGKSLSDTFEEARRVFEEADDTLAESLSALCFDGPAEKLLMTVNTQPALLTTCVAAWRVLSPRVAMPKAAAGHSVGEYAALVAAEVLSFADALRAVRARGRAMQNAVPLDVGSMAAVIGMAADDLLALCTELSDDRIVVPANYNAPNQIVVAGDREAVERVKEIAPTRGAKRVIELAVSAPFHSPLMQPATEEMRSVLAEIDFSEPSFPVLCNVNAEVVGSGASARENLVEQIASPVRWVETMQKMEHEHACRCGVEVGPGRVLAGLARKICDELSVIGFSESTHLDQTIEKVGPADTPHSAQRSDGPARGATR